MKAEITLEKGITSGKCYIFINDTFYVRISKKLFKELYDYLFNKEDNNEQNEMKEIEEIKAVIVRHHSGLGCDVLCDGDQCENCYFTAKDLYCEGYRKVADDEIVIKKSEYDTLLKAYTQIYDNAYQWGLKVGEEKAAIEILQKLKDNIMFADFGCGDGYEEVVDMNTDELKELAKSYGIELED